MKERNKTCHYILFIVSIFLLVGSTHAQSTNPSSPTPITGSYTGKGPSGETNYYFSFTGGPGDVSVRLEIKAKDYSTFARIEIGNDPSNLIAMANMNASTTTGMSTVTKDFKLSTKQSVRIKLTLDGNLEQYKLSLNGGGPTFSGGQGNSGSAGNGNSGNSGSGKSGAGGKLGKLLGNAGGNMGSVGNSGGKSKTEPQGSENGAVPKLDFTCPNEVMYKIVPEGEWNATLYSQKRFLFQSANIDGPRLTCSYKSIGSDDSAILVRSAPAGYTCTVFKAGSKSRDFVCKMGATAE